MAKQTPTTKISQTKSNIKAAQDKDSASLYQSTNKAAVNKTNIHTKATSHTAAHASNANNLSQASAYQATRQATHQPSYHQASYQAPASARQAFTPKKTRNKFRTQFHLAQRNYKRIIKRLNALSGEEILESTAAHTASHTHTSQQSPSAIMAKIAQNLSPSVIKRRLLRAITIVLELPISRESRTIFAESMMATLFAFCAALCVVAVLAICFFLFGKSIPTIMEVGVWDFLLGQRWSPTSEIFGIFPMIVGSVLVSGIAVFFGACIGVLSAVYLAYFCPKSFDKILTPAVELLAGIPSIVYGFFGLVVIATFIDVFAQNGGMGLLTASILLAIMILPTIILIAKTSIQAVPKSYYEGAIALGASSERAVFFVVLSAAKSGILASIVLGLGRAIGEAMAVVIVAGNQPVIPESITDGVRTLTTNIVMELGYAEGLHRDVLIACGVVLFVFILLLNLSFKAISKRL